MSCETESTKQAYYTFENPRTIERNDYSLQYANPQHVILLMIYRDYELVAEDWLGRSTEAGVTTETAKSILQSGDKNWRCSSNDKMTSSKSRADEYSLQYVTMILSKTTLPLREVLRLTIETNSIELGLLFVAYLILDDFIPAC